mgnify:FL=1
MQHPFTVVLVSYAICPMILMTIWTLLVRENARRDSAALAAKVDGKEVEEEYVDVHHPDGTTTVEKVDRAFMDLTDTENQEFRCVSHLDGLGRADADIGSHSYCL